MVSCPSSLWNRLVFFGLHHKNLPMYGALYLKGIHLNLDSWMDGRDADGWKSSTTNTSVPLLCLLISLVLMIAIPCLYPKILGLSLLMSVTLRLLSDKILRDMGAGLPHFTLWVSQIYAWIYLLSWNWCQHQNLESLGFIAHIVLLFVMGLVMPWEPTLFQNFSPTMTNTAP